MTDLHTLTKATDPTPVYPGTLPIPECPVEGCQSESWQTTYSATTFGTVRLRVENNWGPDYDQEDTDNYDISDDWECEEGHRAPVDIVTILYHHT